MNNKIIVDFDIYPEFNIDMAIRDYKKVAAIRKIKMAKSRCCELEFTYCQYPVEETMLEFENYLIEVTCFRKNDGLSWIGINNDIDNCMCDYMQNRY